MLNRSVLIIRYRQPFIDWINSTGTPLNHRITIEEANDDNTAYLIEPEDLDELEDWLAVNGVVLFEEELNGWITDPDRWPKRRTTEMLKAWCVLEFHSLVIDTGEGPVIDEDEMEEGMGRPN